MLQVTSGATSDLKHATQQARHMVMECGMSNEIGPVYIPEEKSAETRKLIDTEVTKILREAHGRVTVMLVQASPFTRMILKRSYIVFSEAALDIIDAAFYLHLPPAYLFLTCACHI